MRSWPTRRAGYACSTTARSTASWSMAAASSGARWSTATNSPSAATRCITWTLCPPPQPRARKRSPTRWRPGGTAAPPDPPLRCGREVGADTIAVLSLKGGTGKTTTVRTLADVLRRSGLDVLAIDLDPQGNLSDYFDVPADASPSIADVLSGDAKVKSAAHDGIVPATPILAEVERALSGKMGRELVLRKALKDARKSHDVVLIDCPPALGLLTINGLVAADWAL